jgi:hypothetical protein
MVVVMQHLHLRNRCLEWVVVIEEAVEAAEATVVAVDLAAVVRDNTR